MKTFLSETERLVRTRARLLERHPFFGRILLQLPLVLASCGTAATDMERIYFDPNFMAELKSDSELAFVMVHEALHDMLQHPLRSGDKDPLLYNIAADIVVNSIALKILDADELPQTVAGNEPFHLTPSGHEGDEYTVEEVYRELAKETASSEHGTSIDNHSPWGKIRDGEFQRNIWRMRVSEALSACNNLPGDMPLSLYRQLQIPAPYKNPPDWRDLLADFLRPSERERSLRTPSRRHPDSEIVFPGLAPLSLASLDGVLIFVDTSGSISERQLSIIMNEVCRCASAFESFSGHLFFFDSEVKEPGFPLRASEDLKGVVPLGGGGTSFEAIFRYIRSHWHELEPQLVLVLTDGYAAFPQETDAEGLPVLWLIVKSPVQPPWGLWSKIED